MQNTTATAATLEASDLHATDLALLGECRKCEQNDPTYRYEDCPQDSKVLTSLTIIVREYWDKTYGNTYHSARIVANGETVAVVPMTYGHGDHTYLATGSKAAQDAGYQLPPFTAGKYKDLPGFQDYREAGVPFVIDVAYVARRKDLHK